MSRGRITRGKAIVGILVAAALLEALVAVAVFAQDDGQTEIAEALPLHPVAGTFEPDGTQLEECSDLRCLEQAYGNIAYYEGPRRALAAFDAEFGGSTDPDCHRVAHAIGSASLARNEGNVARTFAQGSSTCFSGYYHGVLERSLVGVRGREPERLGAVARGLCQDLRAQSLWLFYQCLHGLGHGLMITTGYSLPLSLKACDQLAAPWDRTSCNGGVFMENISTSYGFKSSWLRDDDPVYPCNAIAEEDKQRCYEVVTSRILRIVGGDWAEASEICARVERGWVRECFLSLGRDTAGQAHYEPAGILQLCARARPYGGEATCLHGSAMAMTANFKSGRRAAILCNSIREELRGRCFYGIGRIMALYGPTAARRATDCRSLTQVPAFVRECVRGGEDYLRVITEQ